MLATAGSGKLNRADDGPVVYRPRALLAVNEKRSCHALGGGEGRKRVLGILTAISRGTPISKIGLGTAAPVRPRARALFLDSPLEANIPDFCFDRTEAFGVR